MKKYNLFFGFLMAGILLMEEVSAHCPLCTVGAGAAGGIAVWLGVSEVVVALFIGGFGISMGMWFARVVKKKYIPMQSFLIIAASFLLTVIPILPIIGIHHHPLFVSLAGEYGSLLNKTYMINLSWVASFLGGGLVYISPSLNKKIKEKRGGKGIPFQGTILTLVLLVIVGIVLQFTIPSSSGMIAGSVELVGPDEFSNIINDEEVFLLNVHTPYYGKIEGTDLVIEDWENVEDYMNQLPKDASSTIAVYCRSGTMSASVAEKLKEMGYKVYDLDGGMNAWEKSGREIVQ